MIEQRRARHLSTSTDGVRAVKVDTFIIKDALRREGALPGATRDVLYLNTLSGAHSLHPGGFPTAFASKVRGSRSCAHAPSLPARVHPNARMYAALHPYASMHARRGVARVESLRDPSLITSHHPGSTCRWALPREIASSWQQRTAPIDLRLEFAPAARRLSRSAWRAWRAHSPEGLPGRRQGSAEEVAGRPRGHIIFGSKGPPAPQSSNSAGIGLGLHGCSRNLLKNTRTPAPCVLVQER